VWRWQNFNGGEQPQRITNAPPLNVQAGEVHVVPVAPASIPSDL
jgi:hypothetical protein